jgi:hypothetical protein
METDIEYSGQRMMFNPKIFVTNTDEKPICKLVKTLQDQQPEIKQCG